MRVVGGAWRGRPLQAPKGHTTRPTSDRVREALFDALSARLGGDLGGGAVLDLYAGTGALGLEALSRGAARAVFVENDKAALDTLRRNIDVLGVQQRTVIVAADAAGPGLSRASSLGPFALLLIDAPYRMEQALVATAVTILAQAGALEADALVVVEHAASEAPVAPMGFEIVRTYRYGVTAVTLMLRSPEEMAG